MNACPKPVSRLTVSGPTIWPALNAAVMTPTASEAGAPPSRSASLRPAIVMIMNVPPTHTAESSNVGTLTASAGASTPAARIHFARVHNCRGETLRPNHVLAKVDRAAAAPNTGQKAQEPNLGSKRGFSFLLVGRTGVGKSSTVNSLMGQDVAPTDAYQPMTSTVQPYPHTINGVKFTLVDTPGLCDELEEQGKDKEYLDLIQASVNAIDSLWYVTRLDDARVSSDEKRGIKILRGPRRRNLEACCSYLHFRR